MRLVVPYVPSGLRPATLAALGPWHIELRDVSLDDEAYWRLLRDLWLATEDTLIVEQDIVAPPDIVQGFLDCHERWCAATYPFEAWPALVGLGCTRFSGDLMVEVPDALDQVTAMADEIHPARHWCALDARLAAILRGRGFAPHIHGQVDHLSLRRSHSCA